MLVPFVWIVEAALLYPASKIIRRELVGKVEKLMARIKEGDGRILVRDALVAECDRVWRKLWAAFLRVWIPFVRFVVEDDERPACVNIIKQARVGGDELGVRLVAAIVDDDRIVAL